MTNLSSTRRAAVAALVAFVLAVLGTAVAITGAVDLPASAVTASVDQAASALDGDVAGTRVAAHDHPAAAVVAASNDVLAGQGRATTTSAAKEVAGSRVAIGPTGNSGAFAFEGVTGLTSKGAARSALGGLDATSAQLTAANRAIGRATSSSAINVGVYGERVVVQITRPGANGYQLIETVVARDGNRTVVQMAYDSAGRLVHYDPKFPWRWRRG